MAYDDELNPLLNPADLAIRASNEAALKALPPPTQAPAPEQSPWWNPALSDPRIGPTAYLTAATLRPGQEGRFAPPSDLPTATGSSYLESSTPRLATPTQMRLEGTEEGRFPAPGAAKYAMPFAAWPEDVTRPFVPVDKNAMPLVTMPPDVTRPVLTAKPPERVLSQGEAIKAEVDRAAEAYRSLPADSPERANAMEDYRNAVAAQMALAGDVRAEKEAKGELPKLRDEAREHYDEWYRTHVTAPYNDPNAIGTARLVTNARTGRRELEMPSLERERTAASAYNKISAEMGRLTKAENMGYEQQSPAGSKFAAEMRRQKRQLQKETGIGKPGGYEQVFRNELARATGELDDIMAKHAEARSAASSSFKEELEDTEAERKGTTVAQERDRRTRMALARQKRREEEEES